MNFRLYLKILRYHKPELSMKKEMGSNFNGVALCLYGTRLLNYHSGLKVHACLSFQACKSDTVPIKILSKANLSLIFFVTRSFIILISVHSKWKPQ